MTGRNLNRTYSRQSTFNLGPSRKPLGKKYFKNYMHDIKSVMVVTSNLHLLQTGTFNSAPVLPNKVCQVPTEDSLDDFVVKKKPNRKKKNVVGKKSYRQPKNHVEEEWEDKSSSDASQSSSEDPVSLRSPPTPVFRAKDDTFDK